MEYEQIVTLIVNILRTLLLKKVMDLSLTRKDADGFQWKAGFGTYYFVTAIAYSWFQVSVVYELCNGFGIASLTLFYQETWKKRVWVSLLLFGVDMACSLAVCFFFADNGSAQQPAVQVLLLFICVTAISHRFRFHTARGEDLSTMPFDLRQTVLLLVIPAAGMCVLCVLLYGDFRGTLASLICICTLIMNLSVFYLYDVLSENYMHVREHDVYRQQTAAYRNQLEVIMESQKRIRALKHDMKNHMLALQALLQKNDTAGAQDYLTSMQRYMMNPSEYVVTGNAQADSLLNYKLQKAKNELYNVETKINIPEKLNLHSFDLNVVLGNLLDNAIEASMQTAEKKLKITMQLTKGILFLNICNSCQGIADGRSKSLETTKTDKGDHGIGLRNVRGIVEKYHGEMEFICENGCMEADIMMYVKDL